jgi:hypothetical protein
MTGYAAGWIATKRGKLIGALAAFFFLLFYIVLSIVVNRDYTAYMEANYDTKPALWIWIALVPAIIGEHLGVKHGSRANRDHPRTPGGDAFKKKGRNPIGDAATEEPKRAPTTHAEAFRRGQDDACIKSYRDALLRATLVGIALAVSLFSPVAWYWKVIIFLVFMFVLGVITAALHQRREISD